MKTILLAMISVMAIAGSASAEVVNCTKGEHNMEVNNGEIIRKIEGRNLGYNIRAHVVGTLENIDPNGRERIVIEDAGRKVILFSEVRRSLAIRNRPLPERYAVGNKIELCGYVNIVEMNTHSSTPGSKEVYAFTSWTSYDPTLDGSAPLERDPGFVKFYEALQGRR